VVENMPQSCHYTFYLNIMNTSIKMIWEVKTSKEKLGLKCTNANIETKVIWKRKAIFLL
jgi:hypothetical protein